MGEILLLQQQFEDAKQHLLAGYGGLIQLGESQPSHAKSHLSDAIQFLVDHAKKTGDNEELTKWQAKLSRLAEVSPVD